LASTHGYADIVKQLLTCWINVNARDNSLRTALHFASQGGYFEVVNLLLGDPNIGIDKQDIFGDTPLHNALLGNHLDVAQRLINANADVNIKNQNGKKALDLLCLNFSVMPAPYDYYCETALSKRGATDSEGNTGLHLAILQNNTALVKRLVAMKEININAKNGRGDTPLHLAIGQLFGHRTETAFRIQMLWTIVSFIDRKHDNEISIISRTITHFLLWGIAHFCSQQTLERIEAIKNIRILLKVGAKIDISNDHLKTALGLAKETRYFKIAKAMQKAKKEESRPNHLDRFRFNRNDYSQPTHQPVFPL